MQIKKHTKILAYCLLPIAYFSFSTCTKDVGRLGTGYPIEIANILVNKCATAGCHTRESKEAAAGLSLETWDDLFKGDRNGAVCIPFSHGYSTLFLYCNTDPALGAINTPRMPLNKPALSEAEINTLIDWIDNGAPSADGKIAFADSKKKIYVTNQGCDVVTVFDAATQLQMRYINVGSVPQIESPHMVKVSPDGKCWYVVFSAGGNYMQKYNTTDDSYSSQVLLSALPGSWNTLTISNDSKTAFSVDWNSSGRIAHVDLNSMSLLSGSPWTGFTDPHGSGLNAKGDTLYVTSTTGNFLFKIPVNDPGSFTNTVLNPPAPPTTTNLFEPHDIAFSIDSQYYYVTCPKSNEVRAFRVSDDALVAAIPTGEYPLEISLSKTTPYMFVTCEKDLTAPETNRGCVSVIDLTTHLEVKRLRLNMAEPHGIGVDDANGLVYVANRNISGASIPHHTSNCGGTNGFISFIDLNTLTVIPDKRIEVAVDPYSIAVRE